MTIDRAPRPAPVEAEGIVAALQPLPRSRMLPAVAYTGPAVLAWELEHFFARSWTCVGRVEDLPIGGQRAVSAGSVAALLTRDTDGRLRAFANLCRHRAHELLPAGASSAGRAVTCPYHAWSYRLDGSLMAAPGFADLPADSGLVSLPVEVWHGWVFVSGYAGAPPFADHVGALDRLVAPYAAERLVRRARTEYVVDANWRC